MADQLDKVSREREKPDVSGLNFLDLMKPELLSKPADEPPKAVSADVPENPNSLTIERAQTIAQQGANWTNDEFYTFVEKMSKVDQEVALKLFLKPPAEVTELWLSTLKREAQNNADLNDWFKKEPNLNRKFELSPAVLTGLFGPKPVQELKNFVELLDRIGDPHQSLRWQQNIIPQEALLVANSPLKQLPDNVISDLIKLRLVSRHQLEKLPAADVQRLLPAAKGWAVDPSLPLNSAERIGKLPILDRIAAAVALHRPTEGTIVHEVTDKFLKEVVEPLKREPDAVLKKFGEIAADTSEGNLRNSRFHALVELLLPDQNPDVQKSITKELSGLVGLAGDKSNPADVLKSLNAKVFQKSLEQNPNAPANALKLALIFKSEDQLAEFFKTRSNNDVNDLMSKFKLNGAKETAGLADWLLLPLDPLTDHSNDVKVMSSWGSLTENQRKLGRADLNQCVNDVFNLTGLDDVERFGPHESVDHFKAIFRLFERFPGLSANEMMVLSNVAVHQPDIAETLKTEHLLDAIKGWKYEVRFPPELAAKVGSSKNVWEQAAAKLAWQEASKDAGQDADVSKVLERYAPAFDRIKGLGKQNVLLQLGDPHVAVKSMFGTLEPEMQDSLAKHVMNLHSTDRENAVKKLLGLSSSAFRDSLTQLRAENFNLDWHIIQNVADQWQPASAYGLASVFGKDWKQWMDRTAKLGIDSHDATYWLPQRSPSDNLGLKEFLFRHIQTDRTKLELVSKKWPEMTAEQRKLPLDAMLTLFREHTYLNNRDKSFAEENAKWGVNERFYKQRETRFLAARDTPSPFPMDKSWESGNLKGFFLPRNDARGLYLGQHTGCCQHPDNVGAPCAWHGQESPDGGFFVVVDKTKPDKILAASWTWVSDNGGLCFDSIESKSVAGNEKDLATVYKQAGKELSSNFHTVTVSKASKFGPLSAHMNDCPAAGERALPLPSNYAGKYSDAKMGNQVVLAHNDKTPKRNGFDNQSWIRGGTDNDVIKITELAKEIYQKGFEHLVPGDIDLMLQTREHGPVGYAILDRGKKQINDLALLSAHKDKSELLLQAVTKQIGELGGVWQCNARESTSYELLQQAEKQGLIKINEVKPAADVNGEKVFAVKFEVIKPAVPSPEDKALDEKAGIAKQERQAVTRPGNDHAGSRLTPKAAAELSKQLASAIEVHAPEKPGGGKQSLTDLTPELFTDVLKSALTKMKNSSDITDGDQRVIEELEKTLETRGPTDLPRVTKLQTDLATLSGLEPKANSSTVAGDINPAPQQNPATRVATPKATPPQLPHLTIVTEAAEKKAGTEIKHGKVVSLPEEKMKAPDTKTNTAKKPGLKTAAKVTVAGLGGLVGLGTLADQGLKWYEQLTEEKKDEKKKEK
jgi:hypothetical protein